MASNNGMKLALVTILAGIIVGTSSAATYTVGDKTGWTIPPSSSLYTNWVSKQSFKLGDVLVFNFPVGAHTVAEVSKTAYDSCNTNNPLSAVKTTAPSNYTLSSGGTHYFICTITGHCSAGQKISIPVSATAPAPVSSKKTTPPPASTPASAPSPAASAAATSPAPSPTTSTGGAPTPAPAPATGTTPAPAPAPVSGTTPAPTPAAGTTASPPSPVGPSPTAGSVPTPASGPSGGAAASGPTVESTPPPSAAPAVGGFGLLSLFSVVVLALF